MSALEDLFAFQLRAAKITGWEREYVFAPPRKFRFDFAFPHHNLAVEVQGGIWTGGRHSRGSGLLKQYEKGAIAAIMGWRVIEVAGDHIKSGQALGWVGLALGAQRE